MRLVLVLLALLSLASLAAAADNASIGGMFGGNGTGIVPPGVSETPSNDAPADAAAESYAAGLLAASAPMMEKSAAAPADVGPKDIILEIRDAGTGDPIRDAHIRVFLDNGREKTGTLRYVGDDGKMALQLADGQWGITLMLDVTSTPGKDYYAGLELAVGSDQNITAFMQPVGSLSGEVLDASNSLLPGAEVKFDCAGDYGITDPVTTDGFGSFKAEWLPVGSCKVSALYGNKAGSMSVQVAQGQLSEVRISLDQGIATVQNDYTVPIAAAIIVAAIIVAFHILRRKSPKAVAAPEPIKADKHRGTIISALDEYERKIVESLMSSGGKSMQSKLGRELGLPKSSLSRAVSGLEAREIVKTERLGRVREVELSEWFLNGKKHY